VAIRSILDAAILDFFTINRTPSISNRLQPWAAPAQLPQSYTLARCDSLLDSFPVPASLAPSLTLLQLSLSSIHQRCHHCLTLAPCAHHRRRAILLPQSLLTDIRWTPTSKLNLDPRSNLMEAIVGSRKTSSAVALESWCGGGNSGVGGLPQRPTLVFWTSL
jgi:hypothetical protein